jgi:PPP family 3-phenylpropionic acid transporter
LPTSATRAARWEVQTLTWVYFLYFVSYGIYQPYLNLHFSRLGMSGTQIGVLSALRPLTSIVVPPLVGYLADRYGQRRSALTWILFGGVIPYCLVLLVGDFFWLLPAMLLFSAFSSPIIPMLDANALDVLDGDRTRYGLMRRWGSVGYLLAVVATGRLVQIYGLLSLLWVAGVAMLAAVAPARLRSRGEERARLPAARRFWLAELTDSWRAIFRQPGMPAFFFAGFLGAAAATTYYTFFSIFADQIGMPEGMIGLAWGTAVVSEIVLLSLSGHLLVRLGAQGLFAVGLTASAVRWLLYAVVQNPYVILVLQTLHGFTFGAMQAGTVTYLHALVPAERRSGAQTLWAACSGGLAGMAGAYLVGPLSDLLGLRPVFALSGLLAMIGALIGWFGLKRLER